MGDNEGFDKTEEIVVTQGHPLENDLVVETLCKFLPLRDLLRCRLACRKWNLALLPRIRRDFQVRIDDASLGQYATLSRFLSVLLSCPSPSQIPYGSYFLINLKLSNPLLQKLFTIVTPLIKHLRISLPPLTDLADIYALRELLIYRAPLLQTLSLSGSIPDEVFSFPLHLQKILSLKSEGHHHHHPSPPQFRHLTTLHLSLEGGKIHPAFISDLLAASPNLRKIKIKSSSLAYTTLLVDRCGGGLKNLNSLDFTTLTTTHLNSLSHSGLLLEEFSFRVLNVEEATTPQKTAEALQKLLYSQRDHLKLLRIGEIQACWRDCNLTIVVPPMKKLRGLFRTALWRPEVRFKIDRLDSSLEFSSSFAHYLPNLVEYDVSSFSDELDWDSYFPKGNSMFPCRTLRKLRIPTGLSDPNKLEELSRMFPNVREVTADSPRNEILVKLWTVWPQLSELSLTLGHRNEGIDSVFTGIPEETCQLLLGLAKSVEEVDIGGLRVGPSIADLRGLRKLHVETSGTFWSEDLYFCDKELSCFLTNITGFFALAYLKHIQDISISSCEISEECCQYLSGVFQKFAKIFISSRSHVPVYHFDQLQ